MSTIEALYDNCCYSAKPVGEPLNFVSVNGIRHLPDYMEKRLHKYFMCEYCCLSVSICDKSV